MNIRRKSSLWYISQLLFLCAWASLRALGQCAGIVTSPAVAADCAGQAVAQKRSASIDPGHSATWAEFIYRRDFLCVFVVQDPDPTLSRIDETAATVAR